MYQLDKKAKDWISKKEDNGDYTIWTKGESHYSEKYGITTVLGSFFVCRVNRGGKSERYKDLILSAPELLESLKDLRDAAHSGVFSHEAVKKANKAINKAEGKT